MAPTRSDASLRVPEARAREILLVRAFEESDPDAVLLSAIERDRATAASGDPAGSAFVVARAGSLLALLRERVHGIDALTALASADLPVAWLVPAALALGFSANVLGERGIVNVLAFPLLGALLWNLGVYVLLAVHRRAAPRPALALGARLLGAWMRRGIGHVGWGPLAPERARAVSNAALRFAGVWIETAKPLLGARLRRAFHLGALALVAGVVGGMYLRGLAFEYRAQWASTFLDAEAAERLFHALFAPARALASIDLPSAETIRAPATGDAAPWIHAWALTALWVVGLPRLLLVALETRRVRALCAALPLPLDAPYWRRLRAAAGGKRVRVAVAAYATPLEPRAADRLRLLLHELLGARAEVAAPSALAYGAEASALALEDGALCVVVVFALAQSPELEVHARFLSELVGRLERRADEARLLVVIDSASFAERNPAERVAERRGAWERALRDTGLRLLHADLTKPVDADTLGAAADALWSRVR